MATWQDILHATLRNVGLRDYMFGYLYDHGHFDGFRDEAEAKWFFGASMGSLEQGIRPHKQNSKRFCEEFLPEYESILKQQNPDDN